MTRDARCTVDGCPRPHMAKGLCEAHYHRTRSPRGLRPESPIAIGGADMTNSCAMCGGDMPLAVLPSRCETCLAELDRGLEVYAKAVVLLVLSQMAEEAVA